jgi:hypothetical protein
MLPDLSTETPAGNENLQLPEPAEPMVSRKLPLESNFTILLLLLSVTYMLPEVSVAMPCGKLRLPVSHEPIVDANFTKKLSDGVIVELDEFVVELNEFIVELD